MTLPKPALHPARGLLHPAWIASLFVLALNDHWLKGSGVLPPVLTGKLSDVAGLMVAPLLLAALLRVRSLGPWVACHLAVGVVFSAIQLSAPLAEGWSALMGMVGFPWVITRDPSDLLALPALALSGWGFLPVMRRAAAANARRSAEAGAAALGLLCCVATSDEETCCEEPPDWNDSDGETDGFEEPLDLPPFSADVYLSNATGQDVVVRIRALRPEVMIDCDATAENPGGLLRSSLFAPATSWMLPPSSNVEVLDHTPLQASCYAAWVEADGLSPTLLFWYEGNPFVTSVPAHGQWGAQGEVVLGNDGLDGFTLSSGSDLVFPADAIDPSGVGVCAPQPDAERLGWSSPVPWGAARIDAVEVGLDGCLSIDLSQGDEARHWYLCVPESSFPFDAGDLVELRLPEGVDPSLDALEIVALGADGEALALPSLWASAGSTFAVVDDIELLALPQYGCEIESEPSCGSAERAMAVFVSGGGLEPAELAPGVPQQQRNEERTVELTLLHAEERFVLDAGCGLGSDVLGPDLEVVVAQWATAG